MSSQICLKWNSFLNNIATSFESLWEEEGLVDVTLASDGQCLTAHKVILSASSPFFKKVFQANPCRHPVIILQDVHFSELEALLIFIYKGEVNIEQANLPALLKAAETLQIRGLSGGDIFTKESYNNLVDLHDTLASTEETSSQTVEESPKKKQKLAKDSHNSHGHSNNEKTLTKKSSRRTSESSTSEKNHKDVEDLSDSHTSSINETLPMKIEPFEVEELQARVGKNLDHLPLLNTRRGDETQGSSASSIVPSSQDNRGKKSISDSFNAESCNLTTGRHPGVSNNDLHDGVAVYPPFPCPFCDRAYTSWGFRRRHIKAVHTISPELNCKWCFETLPTHEAWKCHVMIAHDLSAIDAHNGLLILEEAHMVLQIARPTRLDSLVDIIKQNLPSNNSQNTGKPHPN